MRGTDVSAALLSMVLCDRHGRIHPQLRLALSRHRSCTPAWLRIDAGRGFNRRTPSPRQGPLPAARFAARGQRPTLAARRHSPDVRFRNSVISVGVDQGLLQLRLLDENDLAVPRAALYLHAPPPHHGNGYRVRAAGARAVLGAHVARIVVRSGVGRPLDRILMTASVPIPKFARSRYQAPTNFGIERTLAIY